MRLSLARALPFALALLMPAAAFAASAPVGPKDHAARPAAHAKATPKKTKAKAKPKAKAKAKAKPAKRPKAPRPKATRKASAATPPT